MVICAISCASDILEIAGVARSPSRTSRRRSMLIFLIRHVRVKKLKLSETRWRGDVNAARNLEPAFVRERKPAQAAARIVQRSIVGVLTVEQGQAATAISSTARFR